MSRDQKFFDMYSLVIGILAAFALAVFIVATKIDDLTQEVYTRDSDEYQAAIIERIRPFGEIYRPGEEQESAAPIVAATAEPEPVATLMSGPQVYNAACIACHSAGIGGAPILGDATQWADRIAQGNDTLKAHALQGYTGSAGFMPAKGGRTDLSDKEIEDAVDYMVAEAQ